MNFNTLLLHGGAIKSEKNGSTLPPIYQNNAFHHETAEELSGIFEGTKRGFSYTRVANPTVEAFEQRITKIEGGIASVACASGMAALTNAFLNILQPGDEIISSASLYGGSIELFEEFESFGIITKYVKNNDTQAMEALITERTKVIFAETIGNPKLDVADLSKIAQVAHAHEIPFFVDNTVATAFLVKPLELGADVVIQSSSKYINGSSNAISGILTVGGKFKWNAQKFPGLKKYLKFGPYAYVAKLKNGLFRNTGACLSPQNAFLNLIGVETLGLRMERQCQNAYALASWIEETYPEITVNYPGLESSPWHETAKKQFQNGFGAILTIRVGSKEKAFAWIDALQLPYKLSNIGDTKTLVIHVDSTISLHNSKEQRENAGVYDDLVRISVGIEDITDLKEDFGKAFQKIKNIP